MKNEEAVNPQDIQIQGVIDRYLRTKAAFDNSTAQQIQHLDEDALTAFTEGSLSRREAEPIVKHLIDCSFCRHVTAELIKLDLAFAADDVQVAASETQPAKISEVLSNLISRIFGTADGAVFAHEEKDEDAENLKKPEDGENRD